MLKIPWKNLKPNHWLSVECKIQTPKIPILKFPWKNFALSLVPHCLPLCPITEDPLWGRWSLAPAPPGGRIRIPWFRIHGTFPVDLPFHGKPRRKSTKPIGNLWETYGGLSTGPVFFQPKVFHCSGIGDTSCQAMKEYPDPCGFVSKHFLPLSSSSKIRIGNSSCQIIDANPKKYVYTPNIIPTSDMKTSLQLHQGLNSWHRNLWHWKALRFRAQTSQRMSPGGWGRTSGWMRLQNRVPSWWLNQPIWTNMRTSNWSEFPQTSGWKNKIFELPPTRV